MGALAALSRNTINVEKILRLTRPLRHKPPTRNASERTISEAPRKTKDEAITSNKNDGELRTRQIREDEGYERETNASERTRTYEDNHAYANTIPKRTSHTTETITSQRTRTTEKDTKPRRKSSSNEITRSFTNIRKGRRKHVREATLNYD